MVNDKPLLKGRGRSRRSFGCSICCGLLSNRYSGLVVGKPLKRFRHRDHRPHPAEAHGRQGNYWNRLNLLHGAHLLALLLP